MPLLELVPHAQHQASDFLRDRQMSRNFVRKPLTVENERAKQIEIHPLDRARPEKQKQIGARMATHRIGRMPLDLAYNHQVARADFVLPVLEIKHAFPGNAIAYFQLVMPMRRFRYSRQRPRNEQHAAFQAGRMIVADRFHGLNNVHRSSSDTDPDCATR
ncbi:hypothetical protein PV407_17825 [Paenibacillus sp. GYB003]